MAKKSLYLDFAAATPLDSAVLKAMTPYFSKHFFNPSANYDQAREVKQALMSARSKVAYILGAKPSEVIFTTGGSAGNNLAVHGVMRHHPGSKLIISGLEHPSVIEPAKRYKAKVCPVNSEGRVNLDKLQSLIDDQTVLISIIMVSNEIGTIEPLSDIAEIIKKVRRDRLERGINLPLYFHSDACQAANYLDLHVSRLGVDLLTLNGGKIYGPKQSGCLFVKSGLVLDPLIDGGGQERGLLSGTENVASDIGFSLALEQADALRSAESRRLSSISRKLITQLEQTFEAVVNGSQSKRIANNVHATFKGVDNEWLLIKLDEAGIQAAAGSACSASNDKPSTVLRAIGLSDELARNSLRFSLGRSTRPADIDYLMSVLKSLLNA